jgi:hypothetical protein
MIYGVLPFWRGVNSVIDYPDEVAAATAQLSTMPQGSPA